jgi:hypothetical protein
LTGNIAFGADADSSAAFWTAAGALGSTGAVASSNVQVTLASISGAGFISHLISPRTDNNGTIKWDITIDGVTYPTWTLTGASAAANYRFVSGRTLLNSIYTTAANDGGYAASTDFTTRGSTNVAAQISTGIRQIEEPSLTPINALLRFEQSAVIKMTTSTVGTGTQLNGAVLWRLTT